MRQDLIVLKFGGSVLRDRASLGPAVHEIYRHYRRGARVVAVVSAFEGVTDALLREASGVCDAPAHDRTAALLATGELATAALLGLALQRAGVPAATLSPHEAGLRVRGDALDAEPRGCDAALLLKRLERTPVLVVPGFIGVGEGGELRTLGRGGSDLSAIALAHALGAPRCRLVKDVPALFDRDPNAPGPEARPYAQVTYATALGLGGGIVQAKAVRYAERLGTTFEVGALHADAGTLVGAPRTVYSAPASRPRPLRVGILGLGVVGLGVYRLLRALPAQAEIVGVACRDLRRAAAEGVPRDLLAPSLADFPLDRCDVLVEAVGGLEPAGSFVEAALARGVSVVTANKTLVAARFDSLEKARAKGRASLRFAAAVGGSAPVLETVARLASRPGVVSVEGVLNGTTNAVLAALADGASFEHAVAEARRAGLAEADPSRDLGGLDAADKLAVIARAAWGRPLAPAEVPLDALGADRPPRDPRVRQVASVRVEGDRAVAEVRLRRLPRGHPLLGAAGAENAAVVSTPGGGACLVRGTGAGRWPTAEAVVADVLDLWRDSVSPATPPLTAAEPARPERASPARPRRRGALAKAGA